MFVSGVVETRLIASLPRSSTQPTDLSTEQSTQDQPEKSGGFSGNKNPRLHNNISRIIRWFKGRCSFEMHKIYTDFAWQPRYHDHIIHNDGELERIRKSIIENPVKWTVTTHNGT